VAEVPFPDLLQAAQVCPVQQKISLQGLRTHSAIWTWTWPCICPLFYSPVHPHIPQSVASHSIQPSIHSFAPAVRCSASDHSLHSLIHLLLQSCAHSPKAIQSSLNTSLAYP
jgi:hypothetical protein